MVGKFPDSNMEFIYVVEVLNMESDIIIIGNGPSVLSQKQGDVIDRFRTVVRINNYAINGYESHVGSKTDVWARSGSHKVNERSDTQFRNVLWLLPLTAWQDDHKIASIKRYMRVSTQTNTLIRENEIASLTEKYFENRTDVRPTTGLLSIFYFIEKFQRVSIFGFDFFDTHKKQLHYYDNDKKNKMKGHDIIFERYLVQKYAELGQIIVI